MPKPRSAQISPETAPYYHCNSRCVRRAFLCGQDLDTGIDYEYRKERIEQRILQLADIFCLDVCAYAVMSNHYHVVLHINQNQALSLTTEEIHTRWQKLFKGNLCLLGTYEVKRFAMQNYRSLKSLQRNGGSV